MKRASMGIVLGAAALLLVACASGPVINKRDIPSFYLNPPKSKDYIYGVGEAKLSTLSLSRTTALSRARDDVARQVQVSVKNAISDYAQQAGEGKNQQTIQFVETISRQVADVTLSGVRTERIEPSSDGTVYALVSYPIANLLDAANNEFSRNDAAAFAEFKASEALKRLESEIQTNPPKPGNTVK
jgi:hypothetical protein